jgi:hypothetical protein
MGRPARRRHFRLGLGEGQFQPGLLHRPLPLLRGQFRPSGRLIRRIVLLRLNRFALKSTGHDFHVIIVAILAGRSYGPYSPAALAGWWTEVTRA